MEEIHLGELLDAGEPPVGALIGRGDEAVAQGQPLRLAPQRGDLHRIDAIAPGIPLHEAWLVESVGELQAVELSAGNGAELVEFGLEIAQHVGWQHASEPAAEQRVVAVLVAEFRGALREQGLLPARVVHETRPGVLTSAGRSPARPSARCANARRISG